MLGGRAAEEIVYGTRTTGAENDIEQATDSRAPDGDPVGHERPARDGATRPAGEPLPRPGRFYRVEAVQRETAQVIDAEMQKIIDESHEEAKRLLALTPKGTRRTG